LKVHAPVRAKSQVYTKNYSDLKQEKNEPAAITKKREKHLLKKAK